MEVYWLLTIALGTSACQLKVRYTHTCRNGELRVPATDAHCCTNGVMQNRKKVSFMGFSLDLGELAWISWWSFRNSKRIALIVLQSSERHPTKRGSLAIYQFDNMRLYTLNAVHRITTTALCVALTLCKNIFEGHRSIY